MPAFTATAPGKIILFGEHAVVYGEPAIAAPVQSLEARVIVNPDITGSPGEVQIEAQDIGLAAELNQLEPDHPLRAAIAAVVSEEKFKDLPACQIQITSTIPISSGLGSSAAISAALIRAFSAFLGQRMTNEQVSQAAFEVEKIHHGTPSGIDNSVVAFQQPIYYQKGVPLEFLSISSPFSILIADSGSPGDTRKAVMAVKEGWVKDPDKYQGLFSEIGSISARAREAISRGEINQLGPLMDRNHKLLQELGVSTPKLDHLAQTAREAGALGAKLSGGGLGGHLIALVNDQVETPWERLLEAGAASVFLSAISGPFQSESGGPEGQ